LRVKNLSGFKLHLLMTTYEIFQPLSFSLLISLAKLVFNSVSYSQLVSEVHDVSHCQAHRLSLRHKTALSQIIFYFTRTKLLPTEFCFIASLWACLPVFNITLLCCLWYVGNCSCTFVAEHL
jgi:hypothetical protein